MTVLEGIKIALAALAANIMRSVLTVLGVVIGVASVIAMVGLGQGAQVEMTKRISALGSNVIFITPGKAGQGMIFKGFGSADTITLDDAAALRKELKSISGVAPEISRNVQVKVGNKNNNYVVLGTYNDYAMVHNTELTAGRFFTRMDDEAGRRVAVLGSHVTSDVFGNRYALGKSIKVMGIPFTVVGVMKETGGFGRQDDTIIIPLSTALQRLVKTKYARVIQVTAQDGLDAAAVQGDIKRWLRYRHRLRPGQDDDFTLAAQTDIASTLSESNKIFTMLLAGIAAISLVVGGIGIMNIMLVTVTERTREIGIRKALGARKRDIQLQFLTESTVLSVMGGLLGVLLGLLLASVLQNKLGLTVSVTLQPVLISFGCAAGIGIFFGYYPATRAAALDPIQALRYE